MLDQFLRMLSQQPRQSSQGDVRAYDQLIQEQLRKKRQQQMLEMFLRQQQLQGPYGRQQTQPPMFNPNGDPLQRY